MKHFEVLNFARHFEVIGIGSNLGKLGWVEFYFKKTREIYLKKIRELFEVNHWVTSKSRGRSCKIRQGYEFWAWQEDQQRLLVQRTRVSTTLTKVHNHAGQKKQDRFNQKKVKTCTCLSISIGRQYVGCLVAKNYPAHKDKSHPDGTWVGKVVSAERHEDDTLHYYVFLQVTTPCSAWPCLCRHLYFRCVSGWVPIGEDVWKWDPASNCFAHCLLGSRRPSCVSCHVSQLLSIEHNQHDMPQPKVGSQV